MADGEDLPRRPEAEDEQSETLSNLTEHSPATPVENTTTFSFRSFAKKHLNICMTESLNRSSHSFFI